MLVYLIAVDWKRRIVLESQGVVWEIYVDEYDHGIKDYATQVLNQSSYFDYIIANAVVFPNNIRRLRCLFDNCTFTKYFKIGSFNPYTKFWLWWTQIFHCISKAIYRPKRNKCRNRMVFWLLKLLIKIINWFVDVLYTLNSFRFPNNFTSFLK